MNNSLTFNRIRINELLSHVGDRTRLQLIGDQGVYFRLEGSDLPVVYANECDPTREGDWFDAKGKTFGYSDQVDEIPVEGLRRALAGGEGELLCSFGEGKVGVGCYLVNEQVLVHVYNVYFGYLAVLSGTAFSPVEELDADMRDSIMKDVRVGLKANCSFDLSKTLVLDDKAYFQGEALHRTRKAIISLADVEIFS